MPVKQKKKTTKKKTELKEEKNPFNLIKFGKQQILNVK